MNRRSPRNLLLLSRPFYVWQPWAAHPSNNRRTDRYGGSAERRAALMTEVIEAIRARIGHDFPMQVKINAEEYLFEPQRINLDDARAR